LFFVFFLPDSTRAHCLSETGAFDWLIDDPALPFKSIQVLLSNIYRGLKMEVCAFWSLVPRETLYEVLTVDTLFPFTDLLVPFPFFYLLMRSFFLVSILLFFPQGNLRRGTGPETIFGNYVRLCETCLMAPLGVVPIPSGYSYPLRT